MKSSILTLLWSHAKLAVWIAFVVLGALLYIEHDRHVRDTALADAQLTALHHTEAVLRNSISEQRGAVIRATVKVTPAVTRYHTARDTALHALRDTSLTVAAFATADTALDRYRIALSETGLLNRLLTARVANADSQTVVLRSLIPSRTQRVVTAGKWALIGAGAYAILSHTVLK